MKTRIRTSWRRVLAMLGAFLMTTTCWAQGSIPFTIANTSPFADNELFVAVVGIDDATGNHVWINPRNSAVLPMSPSYNTVQGPTYGGNKGPGQNSMYANCFARLSEIPNKTFTLPKIAGCRVFIAKGQQLYFYFFGASGAPSGYTSPNALDPTDPNKDILYEIIELTNNQYGFFGNTTRVDSYKYPMGLELFGNGYQKRVGELKTHAEIVSLYKANVPAEFQGTVNNTTGEITAPSKTAAFADGTNGTTPGPYANYLKPYIDAIWEKYKNVDLIFYAGDAGVFKGRVIGERLEVVGQSGGFVGRKGMVARRPTTQEALEGKGVLDNRISDGDLDLVIQAQLTAAINRHVVNTTTAVPGQQNWYDATKFYQTNPMNHYAKFWHLPGISVDQLSYGFAYDDVADQSPSLHTPQPTRVIATFGGYAGSTPPTTSGVATFYKDCNYAGTAVTLPAGNYTLSQLQARGILDNDISSVRVNSGYEVQLFENDNFGGASVIINASNSCLVSNSWNDRATSLRVRTITTATPSTTIQAENYNAMNGVQLETTTDTGGGQNVSYIDAGDWMAYNSVNFATSGTYLIEYRVASPSGARLSSDLNAGATQLGNVTIPATGGWQNWTTVSQTVNINAGTYNFGVFAQTGGWNFNWLRITKQGSTSARTASAMTASGDAEEVVVYPNPAVHELHLKGKLAGSQYTVVNERGKTVARGKVEGGSISVENLPNGLYNLVLTTPDQQIITRRFMK